MLNAISKSAPITNEPSVTNVTKMEASVDFTRHTPQKLDAAIRGAYRNAERCLAASRSEIIRSFMPGIEEMRRRLKGQDRWNIGQLLGLKKPTIGEYCRSRGLQPDTVRQWRARYGAGGKQQRAAGEAGKATAARRKRGKQLDQVPESGAAIIAHASCRLAEQLLDPLRTTVEKERIAQDFARNVRECVSSGSYELPPVRPGTPEPTVENGLLEVIDSTKRLVAAILETETLPHIREMALRLAELLAQRCTAAPPARDVLDVEDHESVLPVHPKKGPAGSAQPSPPDQPINHRRPYLVSEPTVGSNGSGRDSDGPNVGARSVHSSEQAIGSHATQPQPAEYPLPPIAPQRITTIARRKGHDDDAA